MSPAPPVTLNLKRHAKMPEKVQVTVKVSTGQVLGVVREGHASQVRS